jgi:hypothetical protein
MATLFIDYENGNDTWGGTSFDVLASGTNGRISSNVFSSATANFVNNGTLCNTKNLIAHSERFWADWWTKAQGSIQDTVITPPSGLSTAFHFMENTNGGVTHDMRTLAGNLPIVANSQYTASVYVKAAGRNQVIFQLSGGAARFNIANGTLQQVSAGVSASISSAGDGWYRLSLTFSPTSSNDAFFLFMVTDSHTGTAIENYTGDGRSGIYVSSPQLELGSSATAYEIAPQQYLSIWNGTAYVLYEIVWWLSSTQLRIISIAYGAGTLSTALANQAVDRQYYIGGRWKTLTNGATGARLTQGDNIRIMASPDPTSIGNATWTSSIMQATKNISSSTNASPIAITSTAHGYSSGDTVFITGHTTNTNANGTWEITVTGANTFTLNGSTGNGIGGATGTVRLRNNDVIRLPSALTQNIASFGNRGGGRTVWTASTNVTTLLEGADYKEGDVSDSIAIGASFTTGKAAYKTTASTLDLSGYQQVSFWIKQTAGTVAVDGDISLRLCTDTIGNTSVHTINIPGLGSLSRWTPITIDLGINLNSAIQSIALYVDVDKGAQTFFISNIIACKASSSPDSISLLSLLSKNTTNEPWWPIQSINGTRIMIDDQTNATQTSTALRGYYGTSETATTYKLEAIKRPYVSVNINASDTVNETGIATAKIVISGGWDRTNMSTRSGITWLDGGNGNGYAIYSISKSYIDYSYLGFVRYYAGLWLQSHLYSNISYLYGCGCVTSILYFYVAYQNIVSNIIGSTSNSTIYYGISSGTSSFTNIIAKSNFNHGFHSSYSHNMTAINYICDNNQNGGFTCEHSQTNTIQNSTFTANGYGFFFNGGAGTNTFISCTSSNNLFGAYQGGGLNYLKNCIINEITEFGIGNPFSDGRIISMNHDNTPNNHVIFTDYGLIRNSVSVRYSNSGFAWSMSPTNIRRDSTYPLDFPIAKVAVNANSLVTIRAWVRRSDNRLTMGLRLKGNQIAGVPNDITSYMSAAADTWEQVTINFTPTEAGVVEVLAECFGGTTYTGYVDDISITQV